MHLDINVELCFYIAYLYVSAMFDEQIFLEAEVTLTSLRSINAFKVTFLLLPLTLDAAEFDNLLKQETRYIFIVLLDSISPTGSKHLSIKIWSF